MRWVKIEKETNDSDIFKTQNLIRIFMPSISHFCKKKKIKDYITNLYIWKPWIHCKGLKKKSVCWESLFLIWQLFLTPAPNCLIKLFNLASVLSMKNLSLWIPSSTYSIKTMYACVYKCCNLISKKFDGYIFKMSENLYVIVKLFN